MIPIRSMPGTTTWGGVGSAIFTFIFFWDMFRRYCPPELQRYLERCTTRLSGFFNTNIHISIHEYTGSHLRLPHEAYNIVEAYLSENSTYAKRLKADMSKGKNNKLMLSMDEYEDTTDVFNGVQLKWISWKLPPSAPRTGSLIPIPEPDRRYYMLEFHKKYKKMITERYLEHVITKGREIQARNRQRKLYTNTTGIYIQSYWSSIVFEHPARFETLAMEPEKKEEIMNDLLTFKTSKNYYAKIGKAWKRGYLLYGPPGTGKSTMIAAMANLLDYDVYDLELTSVKDNTQLRKLLTETKDKSIIVIEDIDCSLDLTGQRNKRVKEESESESESKVTLSGLLNFIDGLWSACAGERLVVFTTNYVDKLDPALTRRGRMDKHIELSYCKYEGFKVLAKNYLELEAHPLFQSVEELIQQVQISPADVAENLMPKSAKEGPEQRLRNLICTLEETKIKDNTKCEEAKIKDNTKCSEAKARETNEDNDAAEANAQKLKPERPTKTMMQQKLKPERPTKTMMQQKLKPERPTKTMMQQLHKKCVTI